jgi:hypothetical protein
MRVRIGDLVSWGVFTLVLGFALGPPLWWVTVLTLYLWLLGGWAGQVCYRKLRDRRRDQAQEAV